jgi:hypothetical protein
VTVAELESGPSKPRSRFLIIIRAVDARAERQEAQQNLAFFCPRTRIGFGFPAGAAHAKQNPCFFCPPRMARTPFTRLTALSGKLLQIVRYMPGERHHAVIYGNADVGSVPKSSRSPRWDPLARGGGGRRA